MAKVRLNGDSSGFIELAAPNAAGSNTLTLPTSNGSANQLLKNSGTAGALAWSTLTEDSSGNLNVDSGTLFVDATNNRVGIGTTSPSAPLHIKSTNPQVIVDSVDSSTESRVRWFKNGSPVGQVSTNSGNLNILCESALTFTINGGGGGLTESARIDSSGRFLVGTTTSRIVEDLLGNGPQGLIQIEATNSDAIMSIISAGTLDAGRAGTLSLGRHRNSTVGGTPTIVQNGDTLGAICFAGGDGTDMRTKGASIAAQVDGTPGVDDMPGRLVFSTTADGASSPTEAMRITQDRGVSIGGVSGTMVSSGGFLYVQRQSAAVAFFNRNTDDGTIIDFRQDNVSEGTISVSGTTVQLNGAHLSRWSQLPGGAPRTEILRGSVLSNLDEMCEWGDEDNEQLNRTKVSDIEGDKNVAGVFVAWDDDDDTYINDFYCAMTGDFIIRIAEGVTVERGDLLMSAGDGTAKPQDDDIIRSKTIAKVTSTHVTCTYDDGSYCVPCVLMAC